MKTLVSVGLDVGTTSTQMVVSRLLVENRASAFSVPEMEIGGRELLYESPVYFTPLLDESHIDGPRLLELVQREYRSAGIAPGDVDTGAVIITGETARRENADAVLQQLSGLAGDFVVATAGPDLESVLAAKGAGADVWSEQTGGWVLHFDIGGGTANMALIHEGQILQTGCLNVGGRLIILGEDGRVSYVSPVLQNLTDLRPGDQPEEEKIRAVTELLVHSLVAAAGLRPGFRIPRSLITNRTVTLPNAPVTISFSGGVADCIETPRKNWEFGDIGPALGSAIRKSRLCAGDYRLGTHTIRATVIGAGSHSTTLSGSTVYYEGVKLPQKNLPVACLEEKDMLLDPENLSLRIRRETAGWDEPVLLFFPGMGKTGYDDVERLARGIAGAGESLAGVVLERDMAKSLGHALRLRMPGKTLLCVDRVRLHPGDYLDVGNPVGGALPVVVKTLILSR